MRNERTREIALSAISAAFAIIAFTLAVYIKTMTLSFYAIAGIATMIPLTKQYWKGAFMTYVVVSICAFFINPVSSVAYIAFFGLYAVLQWILDYKYMKIRMPKPVLYATVWVIKLAYIQLVVLVVWTFMQEIIGDIIIFNWDITYWLIDIVITAAFVLYDILMFFLYKNLQWFVVHKLKR